MNQGGTLAPGPDANNTTISGNYTQHANAKLAIDVGGRSAGGSHDLINVTETTVLDGQLQLSLINGFVPEAADQLTLLGANEIVGLFSNVATGQRIATADGGGSFVVQYGIGSGFDENRLVAYNFLDSNSMLGDFDHSGVLDAADIDMLSRAVGGTNLGFDLIYDAKINGSDREFWVESLMNTYFGDANLDGTFDSADLVQVFQASEYEDAIVGNSDGLTVIGTATPSSTRPTWCLRFSMAAMNQDHSRPSQPFPSHPASQS